MSDRQVQIILGPPGTGKTTSLLKIVEGALSRGIPPERIAYLAFTRKAAYEAQERAMQQFNLEEERFPYFRTLHSLAFRMLELKRDDIMTNSHYRRLGKALGVKFKGIYDENLGIHLGDGLGDKCSRIESLARISMRSLEDQYNFTQIPDLTLHAVRQYDNSLRAYKHENDLLDFTDMLEQYDAPLPVDICIFNEAQDMSLLQKKVALNRASKAKEVHIAGDDDQAIFTFAGAAINRFLTLKGDRVILPQSYRIPKAVHKLALNVVDRIKHRYQKPWSPRMAPGMVEYVADEQQIDFSREGSWLCLSRSRFLLNRLKAAVRQQGHAYLYNGKNSLETDETRAIKSWEMLRKGEMITIYDAKNLVQFFGSKVELATIKEKYSITDFGFPVSARDIDWMSMLKGIAPDEREYLRSCLRNGENFSGKPKITISTIHQSKGGEADSVVLLTDMGRLSWENAHKDEENRVWYVALTRAKENLFLVRARGLRYYEI